MEKALELNAQEDGRPHKIQRMFTNALIQSEVADCHTFYRDNKTASHNARLLSCHGPTAGAWLHCVPKDRYSIMSNEDFHLAYGSVYVFRRRQDTVPSVMRALVL